MEFWVVPNTAGLPTVTLEQALGDAGSSPIIGKGAQVSRSGFPLQSIPDSTTTDMEFDDLVYDELGFIQSGPPFIEFTIPQTEIPIRKVQLWIHCEWTSSLAVNGTEVTYNTFINTVGVGDSLTPGGVLSTRFVNNSNEDEAEIDVSSGHLVSFAQVSAASAGPVIPFNVGDTFRARVRQTSGIAADIVRSTFSMVVLE